MNDKCLDLAKKMVGERLVTFPQSVIFKSIDAQLDFLKKVINGTRCDRSKLKLINLGLYAVREFEFSDPEFADELFDIQNIVECMIRGVKS